MTKNGFTLIELLVVISVIAVLAALAVPAVNGALQKSKDSKSVSNLSQIGLALNGYASDNQNFYPRATGDVPYAADNSDPSAWPWQQQIDPYVAKMRNVFRSPNLPGVEYGYFLGSRAAYLDTGGFAPVNRLRIKEPGKHVLGGECVYWTGTQADADKDDYSQTPSFKPDGSKGKRTPVLFADGHVQSFDQFDTNSMSARYDGVGAGNAYPWSP